MAREEPKPFNLKDLFIDAKLEVIVNGTTFDFLGRKLFSTQFFREGVGFGIINIDIEVNTSLQPLVVITFKDLYGLTVFGGQERAPKDASGKLLVSHDFSVIFDWPPPKFLFSFKGYLGDTVSWVLNLKRTSTSFNSSDGSYELKCEFVPNQWGIFADIPMLFLLAAKSLRRDRIGKKGNLTKEDLKYITSVFDLIKIGKQVEIKTQETTKEFDELINQLGSLKSNIATSLSDSRVLKFGSQLTGVVNNIEVKGFKTISIPQLNSLDSSVNSEEKLNLKISNSASLSALNAYLLLKLKFDNNYPYETGKNSKIKGQEVAYSPSILSTLDSEKNQVIEEINANIRLVEDEIKRRVYSSSKSKLEKITIGKIFSQLGKDAAFIIGSILEAGLKGFKKNETNRRAFDDKLIGEAFPLVIINGEELPATKINFEPANLGVDEYEMKFVRNFINAISEGIARDLLRDDNQNLSDDSTLKSRINNIEMTKGNPYKPFYKDIATNILVRGGIAGFVTRSNDPNRPGDYGNRLTIDNDGVQEIQELSEADMKNISEGLLNQISDIDMLLLKRFCKFFIKFYEPNGKKLRKKNENGDLVEGDEILDSKGPGYYAEYEVEIQEGESPLKFSQLFRELRAPESIQVINQISGEDSGGLESIATMQALEFISLRNYTAKKIINNGIAYTTPISTRDKYWFVVFEGEDNRIAQEANSSISDIEYKNEEKDDPVDFIRPEMPLGYIPINSTLDSEKKELGRVTILKKRVNDLPLDNGLFSTTGSLLVGDNIFEGRGLVVDYSKLKRPLPSFFDKDISSGYDNYLWNKSIYENREDAINDGKLPGEYVVAGDFGYTIFANFDKDNSGDPGNVFQMFSEDYRSRNQRVFIRKACEVLLRKISNIEEKKNQIIGAVLGKAAEQETGLYKQMHTLFHQWQSLAYNKNEGDIGEDDLVNRLEEVYGGSHNDMVKESDTNGLPDGAFIYEFPLQRISGVNEKKGVIKVRDSIINLEPLYKINGETSVLNIIQQVCTKNNFLFVPIPGRASYLNVKDLYSPKPYVEPIDIRNFFHVLFTPTPESRTKTRNSDGKLITLSENHKNYDTNSFVIQYGHPDNQIVSNIQVDTDENKNTAESIVNLQRLVDNENQNKVVTTDCSTLPVLQGRSYKVSLDMLGNAQVYPMQFFFLENSPLFGGLYQVMSVKHSITPNNMKTSVSGIRMRFADSYGAVYPVTLQTFKDLGDLEKPQPFTKDEKQKIRDYEQTNSVVGGVVDNVVGGVVDFFGGVVSNISGDPAIVINPKKIGSKDAIETPVFKKTGINLRKGSEKDVLRLYNKGDLIIVGDATIDSKHFSPTMESAILLDGKYYLERKAGIQFLAWMKEMKEKNINPLVTSALRFGLNTGAGPHGYGIAVDFNQLYQAVHGSKDPIVNLSARVNYKLYRQMAEIGVKYGWYNPWRLSDTAGKVDEIWHFEYWGPAD